MRQKVKMLPPHRDWYNILLILWLHNRHLCHEPGLLPYQYYVLEKIQTGHQITGDSYTDLEYVDPGASRKEQIMQQACN